jgi:hypothetical protein
MKYIEYLDLPTVPENLIEPIQDIINKPPKDFSTIEPDNEYFQTRYVNDDLMAWIQTLFDYKVQAQYQLVYKGLPIHIDRGNRVFAYNYLLDTGGDDVRTAVYDNRFQLLQSEKLEVKRWHRLSTGMRHTVHGIDEDKVRAAISIGFTSYPT